MDVLMVRSLMIKFYRKGFSYPQLLNFTVRKISRPQYADHFDQRSI